jgi:hypothetical protein
MRSTVATDVNNTDEFVEYEILVMTVIKQHFLEGIEDPRLLVETACA